MYHERKYGMTTDDRIIQPITASTSAVLNKVRSYGLGEEIASATTHGIGAGLGIAGMASLIVRAAGRSDALSVVAVGIYGASLILLYLMSTLYHALSHVGAKKVFKVLDHSAIYLLIAGTYTAYALSILRGPLGWTLFGVVWGCAVAGISMEAFWVNRSKVLSAALFLAMGWIVVFAIKPIKAGLSPESFTLLVAGGMAYSLGAVVYALKKVKWSHSVWHLFVLAGSIFHFASIWVSY
jgi:hemolysin III